MRFPIPALVAFFAFFGVAAPANALPSDSDAQGIWSERADHLSLINPMRISFQAQAARTQVDDLFGDDLSLDQYSADITVGLHCVELNSLAKVSINAYGGFMSQSGDRLPQGALNQPHTLDFEQYWGGVKLRVESTEDAVVPDFVPGIAGWWMRSHFEVGFAVMSRSWEEDEIMGRIDIAAELALRPKGSLVGFGPRGLAWFGLEDGSFGNLVGMAEVFVDLILSPDIKLELAAFYAVSELGDKFEVNGAQLETIQLHSTFGAELSCKLSIARVFVGYAYGHQFRVRLNQNGLNNTNDLNLEDDSKAQTGYFGLLFEF